jgi:hypothetical protein
VPIAITAERRAALAGLVVREPGDGWHVMRTSLASERVAMGAGSSVGNAVEDLIAPARRPLRLAGTVGAADDGEAAALLDEFLRTRCVSVAGGSTQILLPMVALPREEAR